MAPDLAWPVPLFCLVCRRLTLILFVRSFRFAADQTVTILLHVSQYCEQFKAETKQTKIINVKCLLSCQLILYYGVKREERSWTWSKFCKFVPTRLYIVKDCGLEFCSLQFVLCCRFSFFRPRWLCRWHYMLAFLGVLFCFLNFLCGYFSAWWSLWSVCFCYCQCRRIQMRS